MALFGLQDVADDLLHNDAEDDVCEIEPDNVETVGVFCALGTQWRVIAGMAGAVYQGLEYSAIPPVMEMLGVPVARRKGVFEGLRIMERAVLEYKAEESAKTKKG
ncbi:DUF1799 domain-containing protein [Undibacterium squillarum]|uniref:Uncharacterized protein n=1 Tax=Undibacterium squillarum TaxID=1131567 RepID=A0ABQ2Y2J0_9BURK|nr:DUF1799 domain-containing protein [Undibacterium squillarum]GGX52981.1 hypothetical protein GCM10010946_34460 [Undibacterium squillarum]